MRAVFVEKPAEFTVKECQMASTRDALCYITIELYLKLLKLRK